MGGHGNKIQSAEKLTNAGKIPSSASFHQYLHMFHMTFNICFQHLVLLEMISFKKKVKTVAEKFAIQVKQCWYKVFVH